MKGSQAYPLRSMKLLLTALTRPTAAQPLFMCTHTIRLLDVRLTSEKSTPGYSSIDRTYRNVHVVLEDAPWWTPLLNTQQVERVAYGIRKAGGRACLGEVCTCVPCRYPRQTRTRIASEREFTSRALPPT